MGNFWHRLLLFCILGFLNAQAQQSTEWKWSYWLDSPGNATPQDLNFQKFDPIDQQILNLGFHSDVLWLRLEWAPSKTMGPSFLDLGNPFLAHSSIYWLKDNQTWDSLQGGPLQSNVGFLARQNIFELDSVSSVLIKIQTPSAHLVPIQIMSEEALFEGWSSKNWTAGLQVGSLTMLALYNFFFLFLSLRSRAYLYYVFMILGNAAYLIYDHGLGFHIFPNLAYPWQLSWGILVGTFICICGLQFSRLLMDLKTHAPILDGIHLGGIAVAFIVILCYLITGNYSWLALQFSILVFAFPFIVALSSLYLINRGMRELWIFALAWILLGLGAVTYMLTVRGFIPANSLTLNSYRWASVTEALLLTFAITKHFYRLIEEKESLQKTEKFLREMNEKDALTGLYNRRYFDTSLWECIHQPTITLSVLMLDVDHFKSINDRYGHTMGDEVLKQIGALLKATLRSHDIPCRYGGEEFVVLLPGTELTIAKQVADRIRVAFSEIPFEIPQELSFFATLSVGVAQHSPQEEGKRLMERADMALYWAKNLGRNRTACAIPD
jgi:diguanylate cyclase (GGDEF)-like protein